MKKVGFVFSFVIILWLGLGLVNAYAHESEEDHTVQLADYLDFETVSNPQISPDGESIIYTRRRIDKLNDKFVSTLWLMDRSGDNKRQLLKGSGAKWSPDGSRIAYLAQDDNGKRQIFVRHMNGEGLISQITSFENAPRSFYWSPNSNKIAFVARVPLKNSWTCLLYTSPSPRDKRQSRMPSSA